jgi:hypothetical protein
MSNIDYNIDEVAKWLRIIAVVITLISGFFSMFQGILSSKGLGLGGVLFHMLPGFFSYSLQPSHGNGELLAERF